MLFVVSAGGDLILSTNAYNPRTREKVFPQLERLGYDPAALGYYDEADYYSLYPGRRESSDMEKLSAKIDYVSMIVEGLVIS